MKAIAIDEFDEKPRKKRASRRPPAESTRSEFRLRDSETGLYLSGRGDNMPGLMPEFNASGRRWGTRAAAERVWAELHLSCLIQGREPPKLVMDEFEVVTTLKGEVDVIPVDPSPYLKFATSEAPYHVTQMAKKLIMSRFPFTHMVVLRPENIDVLLASIPQTMTNMVSEIRLSHMYHGGDEPRRDEAIIAVTSAADMMVLHLTHYDDLSYIYDAEAVRTHVGPQEEH